MRSKRSAARRGVARRPRVHLQQHLGDTEETHHHRDERDPLHERGRSEREPRVGHDRVETHERDREARHAHEEALHEAAAGEPHHHADAEERQGEVLRGPEAQGERRQRHGGHREHEDAHHLSHEGAERVHPEREAGLPLLRQRVAVPRRRDRRGRAWRVDQDGRDAAAHDGRAQQAEQHGERLVGRQPERQRREHRQPHRGGEPGQRPEDDAEHDAHGEIEPREQIEEGHVRAARGAAG
jgi:hypothetical protein